MLLRLLNRPHGYNRKCHRVTSQPDPLLHSHTEGSSHFHFVTSKLSGKEAAAETGGGRLHSQSRQSRDACLNSFTLSESLPFPNNEGWRSREQQRERQGGGERGRLAPLLIPPKAEPTKGPPLGSWDGAAASPAGSERVVSRRMRERKEGRE